MPLFGGFRIGRWFGFPIRIDWSWFLVAALVVWTFSSSEFPRLLRGYDDRTYLAMGVSAALLFFLSVLLHELGHAIVGRMRGVTVESITLFIFGGIAQAREEARRPSDEFWLTAAGPLTSLALAGLFHLARLGLEAAGAPPPVATVAGFLALINLVLAIFNMIPGFPLDGGRIFRSIVWALTGDVVRATRWAAWGGRLFGGALMALGVWWLLAARGYGPAFIGGLWSVLIGWFLVSAASSSYRHFELRELLRRIPVSHVMSESPLRIPAETTVDRAIEDYVLRERRNAFPVDMDGLMLGLVDVSRIAQVPESLRATTRVVDIMRPAYEVAAVRRDETLAEALSLVASDFSSLFVVEDQRIVGMLDVREIGAWARRMERFGLVPRAGHRAPLPPAREDATDAAPDSPGDEEPIAEARAVEESA